LSYLFDSISAAVARSEAPPVTRLVGPRTGDKRVLPTFSLWVVEFLRDLYPLADCCISCALLLTALLMVELGPARPEIRNRGTGCPALCRSLWNPLSGNWRRPSASCIHVRLGTRPTWVPAGQLHLQSDMDHTNPDTMQTRSPPCRTSPTDWAASAPPDASC
jgi:hypothetical protein